MNKDTHQANNERISIFKQHMNGKCLRNSWNFYFSSTKRAKGKTLDKSLFLISFGNDTYSTYQAIFFLKMRENPVTKKEEEEEEKKKQPRSEHDNLQKPKMKA